MAGVEDPGLAAVAEVLQGEIAAVLLVGVPQVVLIEVAVEVPIIFVRIMAAPITFMLVMVPAITFAQLMAAIGQTIMAAIGQLHLRPITMVVTELPFL